MIAAKRNGDKPHMPETEELVESVQPKEAGNLIGEKKEPAHAEAPSLPVTPLKIAMDDRGRASIPDKLVDPQGIFSQPMVLPGIEGLPFRGSSIPDLKETDPDKFRPKVGVQIFANVLNLADKEDMKYYQQILQLVGNGYAQVSVEERQYDSTIKSWHVFIRWILYYGYITEGVDSDG
jgi:hypothetical protein